MPTDDERDRYLDAVRALPPPTDEQTAAFAEYVAGAKSWYKHLRLHPPDAFNLFLSPHAGMSWVSFMDRTRAFREITDPSGHYARIKTTEYRERFGYWTFFAPYGSRLSFGGEGGTVEMRGAGLRIQAGDDDWLPVPPDLATLGTVWLNCLVHKHRNLGLSLRGTPKHDLEVWLRSMGDVVDEASRDACRRAAGGMPEDTETDNIARWTALLRHGQELERLTTREGLPLADAERERQLREMRAAMAEIRATVYGF